MKKIALFVMALMLSVAANAQFEEGKAYLGASLSGLDLSSQAKQFHFGMNVKGGYLFKKNLMAIGEIGFDHWERDADQFALGASVRYYFDKYGFFAGGGLKYKHSSSYNDVLPGIHGGYAFFVSRTVTIEPELYFDISTKSSDYMCYGLRVGVGVYLFKDGRKN
jgi:hypothetical protein